MSPDERCSWASHSLPFVAASASALALLGVELDQTGDTSAITGWIVAMLAMSAATWWFRHCARTRPVAPLISPIVLVLLIAPLPFEWLLRTIGRSQHPWEVVLILGVQSVACGLAAASVWQRHQPLALISSLFVMMFAITLSAHRVTLVGATVFLLCGMAWLIASHWISLEQRMSHRERSSRPWKVAWIPVMAMAVLMAGIGITPMDRLWALAGWVPSSGGNGQDDPAARRGIGDGEALVAGQDDIQSFGPIENAPFRASEDPSLYDLFNDLYEEPVVRNQKQDRSIALPPEFARQIETEMAKSQRATREFSTHRQSRSTGQSGMKNLASEALFYVKGRTPLHLRQELFDLFDGINWHPSRVDNDQHRPKLEMRVVHQRPWLHWAGPTASFEIFGPTESHAIKVVHLNSKRIPTPLHLRSVHIDKLDDPSFFQWADEQLLQMERDSLPELTAIHLKSETVDRQPITEWKHWGTAREPRTRVLPTLPEMERVRVLAERWTAGLPRGHRQLEAITRRLRNEYTVDPSARAPEDHPCPVAHFLFESHRGPDYQFATAAALLLRSLDYSTRLVGGFYAAPERFDTRKQHTPVVAADTHVWVEVHLSGHQWLTVEPTPGYEVLGPPPEFFERVWMMVLTVAGWTAARWLPLTIMAGVLCSGWWWRNSLIINAAWLWWTCCPAREPRPRIRQTIWFLDLQGSFRGMPRPAGCPPGRWWRSWLRSPGLSPTTLSDLSRLADWASFAPTNVTVPLPHWAEVCRDVVNASRKAPGTVTMPATTQALPNHMPVVALTVGRLRPS